MSTAWPRPGTLACEERRRDALRGEHARHDIGDRDAEAERRAIGSARDAHQPAFGLHDGVVARLGASRSGLPEARDRAIDEPRMPWRHRGVVEAQPGQRAGPEVLDEHIRLRDQPLEDLAAGRLLEIERDAFLVAVDAQEIRAFAVQERRSPAARVVALAGLLDLDDPRAHVGEQHRAIGAREDAGQVENGDTLKGRHIWSVPRRRVLVFAGSA